MHIEFDHISNSIRRPGVYTEYNTTGAVSTLPTNEQNVLMMAPMSKSASQGSHTTAEWITSDIQAAEKFGAGSLAHLMARHAIKNNPLIRLSVIGLADVAGVKAEARFNIEGTATATGTVTVTIIGTDYTVSFGANETAEQIMERLHHSMNKQPDCPVVASVVVENSKKTLSLTAKNNGEWGNELSLSFSTTDNTGLSLSGTAFQKGLNNASINEALVSVAGQHYPIIVSPFTDSKNAKALRDHVERLSEPTEKKACIGVLGFSDTLAKGVTLTESLNSSRITVGWYRGACEPSGLIAAGYAAIIAKEEDPARPLNTLEITGLEEVNSEYTPLFSECNQALFNGLTPITVVNHRVQILRAITTYTKNPANVVDPALLDLTTIRTLDYVRKAIEQRISLRFPRAKLSNKTPPKVRSEILDILYRLEAMEIVENVDANKGKLVVQRNPVDANRVDTVIPTDVVNGLHVVANRIDLIL